MILKHRREEKKRVNKLISVMVLSVFLQLSGTNGRDSLYKRIVKIFYTDSGDDRSKYNERT